MKFPFEILLIVINLAVALFIYIQNGLPNYLKAFSIFILLELLVELSGWYLGEKKVITTMMYNIYTSFEFIFYFWLLGQVIRNRFAKKIIFYCILLYPILVFTEVKMKTGGFHSTTYALGCLLVVAICIFYFYELFRLSHYINLIHEPSFWICSGLLFYYTCSFPIICLVNYMAQLPKIILNNIQTILVLINSLLYISFTIAFLCRFKTRKSIS
jgi:hypothetical protein